MLAPSRGDPKDVLSAGGPPRAIGDLKVGFVVPRMDSRPGGPLFCQFPLTPIPKPRKQGGRAEQQQIIFDEGAGLSTEKQQYDPTPINQ